jgi:ankyrin repeat protein
LLLDSFQTGQVKEKAEFMDMPNANGNSGLHWAAFNGHLEIVKLLLENGASPDLANKIAAQNQNADKPEAGSSSSYLAPSPSYLAEFNGNPQVADFLRNYLEDKEKETELSNTVKTMELDAEEAEGSGDSDDKRGKAEGESKAS